MTKFDSPKSPTEAKQAELLAVLEITDLDDEHQLHPNAAMLLKKNLLNRNIIETGRLISVISRAKDIATSRREAAVKESMK